MQRILSLLCLLGGVLLLTSCGQIAVTITSPLTGETVRADAGVIVRFRTAGDNGAVSFSCQLDGGPVTPCTPSPVASSSNERLLRITAISEGLHTFTIRAVDTARATGTASVSFLADTPLRVAIASPNDLQRIATATVPVLFSSSGATGAVSYACRVDDAPDSACTSAHVLSNLSDGPHSISVTARDGSGQVSSATVPFFKDAGAWPVPVAVKQVSGGTTHTCAVLVNGKVRCWGDDSYGQLGYAERRTIGDDEFPSSAGDVNVGGSVTQIAAGAGGYTCALLDTRRVRCWGYGGGAALGYAGVAAAGDDPARAGDVNVGADAIQVAAGFRHTCALLGSGNVRCWGDNEHGELGYAHTNRIGDDEAPASAGDVDVGDAVRQISLGSQHTCALLASGKVRCWGSNGAGQLGYGHVLTIGDDETPASAGDVNVGGEVVQIAAGGAHTCALLSGGNVRCWGQGWAGRLGYGNIDNVGDDEAPASAGDVAVGGSVAQISAGAEHTCARLQNGTVRCWGSGIMAELGYGNRDTIGDDELPSSAGDVSVGGAVTQVDAGSRHTCALLAHGAVRCWGSVAFTASGAAQAPVLGYPRRDPVGDNEPPSSAGDVFVGF